MVMTTDDIDNVRQLCGTFQSVSYRLVKLVYLAHSANVQLAIECLSTLHKAAQKNVISLKEMEIMIEVQLDQTRAHGAQSSASPNSNIPED